MGWRTMLLTGASELTSGSIPRRDQADGEAELAEGRVPRPIHANTLARRDWACLDAREWRFRLDFRAGWGYSVDVTRGGAVAARRAHNPKVVGSNPTPATNSGPGRVRVDPRRRSARAGRFDLPNLSECH